MSKYRGIGDPFNEKFFLKSLTFPKKLKGGPFSEFFFEKKSHRDKNFLRENPLAPVRFLDDVKILLRQLRKNCNKL